MQVKPRYLAITELALDIAITNRMIDNSGIPKKSDGNELNSKYINREIIAFACGSELESEYFALIDINEMAKLKGPKDLIFNRIARVLKAAKKPPAHLPRSWSEFHHNNLISFFAESENKDSRRWITEIDGKNRCVRFLKISDNKNNVNLEDYNESSVLSPRGDICKFIQEIIKSGPSCEHRKKSFVEEFDLSTIGGKAVTSDQTYDSWLPKLSKEQYKAVTRPPAESMRIVGPAGSGKTLTLCMRAIHISKDASVIGGRKKILIVTHSWAMSERIDQILTILNNGEIPELITVLPLLSVIQLHANTSVGSHYEVLGDDSQEGARRVMEILARVLNEEDVLKDLNVEQWIQDACSAGSGSSKQGELIFDLYEEITGVIAAQNIFPGDNDKIAEYYAMERGDSLPPFDTRQDRIFCMRVFEALLSRLIDRGLITTDQLILDATRVFETFAWNVQRQTEGYDYILVDELQLFGPQERLAISLLARTRSGFAWAAAEDPSQGIFSSLYGREKKSAPPDSIYLSEVHRFNPGLFNFVQYIYGKFPLNMPALNIARQDSNLSKPVLRTQVSSSNFSRLVIESAKNIVGILPKNGRLAVVIIGDVEEKLVSAMNDAQLNPVQLRSFDDVERLTYQKRSIVVSPWQFIGGTQFSHVILVISENATPRNSFARLRELTAIYLGSSRASEYLEIFCGYRVPKVLQDAVDGSVIQRFALEG